jgi:hypothetical protein
MNIVIAYPTNLTERSLNGMIALGAGFAKDKKFFLLAKIIFTGVFAVTKRFLLLHIVLLIHQQHQC